MHYLLKREYKGKCKSDWHYILPKGLSQDSETGCPQLAIVKFWGVQIFRGGPQYTQISTIKMYKYNKIRHDILIQCHGNYMEMKKFNYMLEIDILRNSSLEKLGVLRGLGVQKGTQTPCWLRPCIEPPLLKS